MCTIFISGVNRTAPSGLCWPGYYCISGADRPNPLMLNESQCPTDTVHPILGHACPPGHYCLLGASYPVACPEGSYQVSCYLEDFGSVLCRFLTSIKLGIGPQADDIGSFHLNLLNSKTGQRNNTGLQLQVPTKNFLDCLCM